jgi:Leucine-rich repeat (LRR) protein
MGYQVVGIAPTVGSSDSVLKRLAADGILKTATPYKGTPATEIPAIANAVTGALPPNFTLLGDKDRRVAQIFGSTCGNESNEKLWYWDFNDINLNGPGLFIIDRKGIVQYSWYWRNHHVRLGAETIMATVKHLRDPANMVFTDWDEALKQPAKVVRLNLGYRGLEELSPDIAMFVNLEDLRLNGNKLTSLPDAIGKLAKLKRLEVSENQLTTLPAAIGGLAALKRLDANRNPLKALPAEIGRLTQLRRLSLMYCPVESLPPEIGALANLQVLNMAMHRMKALPPEIGNLTALVHLLLPGERTADGKHFGLEALPPEIGKLTNLVELHLMFNRLKELPAEIGNLTKLEKLGIAANLLESLPPEIGKLKRMGRGLSEGLNASHNRLTTLPKEISDVYITRMILSHNLISDLPLTFGNLATLDIDHNLLTALRPEWFDLLSVRKGYPTRLNFSHNLLTAVPPDIGRCAKRMDVLELNDNQITSLPKALYSCTRLRVLDLTNNKLTALSDAFVNLPGIRLAGNPIPSKEKRRLRKLWQDAKKPGRSLRF